MTPIFAIITGPEIAIVVGLVVLLFGADRIPKLARSMGEAKKEFEAAQRGASRPLETAPSADAGTTTQTSPSGVPPASSVPPTTPPQI